MSGRFGIFIYWVFCAIAFIPASMGMAGAIWGAGPERWIFIILLWIVAVMIWALGRGFRFVFGS